MNWIKKFVSKKMFVTVTTAILTFILVRANALLPVPVPPDTINSIVAWLVTLAGAYVLGQSAVDVAAKINPPTVTTTEVTHATDTAPATTVTTKTPVSIDNLNI